MGLLDEIRRIENIIAALSATTVDHGELVYHIPEHFMAALRIMINEFDMDYSEETVSRFVDGYEMHKELQATQRVRSVNQAAAPAATVLQQAFLEGAQQAHDSLATRVAGLQRGLQGGPPPSDLAGATAVQALQAAQRTLAGAQVSLGASKALAPRQRPGNEGPEGAT